MIMIMIMACLVRSPRL